jgi:hypothetical protein
MVRRILAVRYKPTPNSAQLAGESANPRLTAIKTVPYVPLSHPFVERLIGTICRECLDRTLFRTATDLELKLVSSKATLTIIAGTRRWVS